MGALTATVVVAALLVAAAAAAQAARERPPGRPLTAAALAVVALLLVLLVALVAADPSFTALGYALVAAAAVPFALLLGRGEPGRWASALLAAGAVLVPVLVARTAQVTGG